MKRYDKLNTSVISEVEVAIIPEVSKVEILPVSAKNQPIKLPVFEKKRWLYVLTLPISWLLTLYVMVKKGICKFFHVPGLFTNTLWFDGLGSSNREIKDGAASWKALNIIYNHRFNESILNIVDDFWIGMINAQAVRNRYKLVKQEVRRAILQFNDYKEVRLVSLACGSAQAVIEIMAEFKDEGILVRTILVDIDQNALDYASNLAEQNGVTGQIITIKASVSEIDSIASDFKPQVIEMLGLLDYIPREKAIKLARKIYESLEIKGIFLTCNIAPNIERYFLTWVIDWPMIYRKPSDLVEIIHKAGFSDFRIIYEPLKVHGLVVATKI